MALVHALLGCRRPADTFPVTLVRGALGQSYGFGFGETYYGMCITRIIKGGLADTEGSLAVGDIIVAIDGVPCKTLGYQHAKGPVNHPTRSQTQPCYAARHDTFGLAEMHAYTRGVASRWAW
jgi:C-terminal processing protease CtpA/Prc